MTDEEESRPKRLDRPVLDSVSVDDLKAYIAELREEIERAEGMIAKKQDARGHADSVFKRKERL